MSSKIMEGKKEAFSWNPWKMLVLISGKLVN
jgi:hypothetical protein